MTGPGSGNASGTADIHNYDELVAHLIERRDRLSRRHAELAGFCLNHPEDVAISTIVRLSEQAKVPPATITRFAKELGFAGFPDLQAVFRQRVLGPGPSYSERLSDAMARPALGDAGAADFEHPDEVFAGLTSAAISSLLRIEQHLDRAELEAVVDGIAKADAVHIVAARGAFGIGAYTFYGLANIGKRAHLIDNQGTMRAEQIAAVGPRDVVLVITFDDYTPETVTTAQTVKARGQTLFAITDNELSPVAPLAQHVLYVKEARLGHFRSQVPALVVCQTVIVSVGRRLSS
jgi:DNA-binding MurR/RpiR family transcriptional regulator